MVPFWYRWQPAMIGRAAWRAVVALAWLAGVAGDAHPRLKVTLVQGAPVDKRYRPAGGTVEERSLARVEFCAHCENPHVEGSVASGLTALQGERDYKLTSHVVYALPNDVSRAPMNADEVRGNIAICHRGNVPMVHKILKLQAAGALGVVLVDDGSCRDALDCGRAGSPRLGGFAPKDDAEAWRKVAIPAVFVSQETGDRMRKLMPLEHFEIPKLGRQWVSPRPRRGSGGRRVRKEL